MHILINAVTINETKDSSAIENIVTTHDNIFQNEIKDYKKEVCVIINFKNEKF